MPIKKIGVLHDDSMKFPPDAEIIFFVNGLKTTLLLQIFAVLE